MRFVWVQIFFWVKYRAWATSGKKIMVIGRDLADILHQTVPKIGKIGIFVWNGFFFGKKIEKNVKNHEKIEKKFFFLFFELVFRECFWEHFKPFFRSKRPLKVFWAPIWGVLEILSQRYLPILLYQKVITSCISHSYMLSFATRRTGKRLKELVTRKKSSLRSFKVYVLIQVNTEKLAHSSLIHIEQSQWDGKLTKESLKSSCHEKEFVDGIRWIPLILSNAFVYLQ